MACFRVTFTFTVVTTKGSGTSEDGFPLSLLREIGYSGKIMTEEKADSVNRRQGNSITTLSTSGSGQV